MDRAAGRLYRTFTNQEARRLVQQYAPAALDQLPPIIRRIVLRQVTNYLQSQGQAAVEGLTRYIENTIRQTIEDQPARHLPSDGQSYEEFATTPIEFTEQELEERRRFQRHFGIDLGIEDDTATTEEPVMAMARVAPSGSLADTAGRTSETPVTIPPTITYGLQDTHTTILPTCFYFSAVNLSTSDPLTLRLRLNSFNDIITTGVINASIQTAGERLFINRKVANHTYNLQYLSTAMANFPGFPSTLGQGTDPEVWYRDYFKELYEFYTVLGVEYEIVLANPRDNGRHCLVAYSIETNGPSGATALPTNIQLRDLQGQKQVQYVNCQARTTQTDSEFQIIKGTYKPGQAKRDVTNDSDVKLWTTTTANATPSYIEALQLMFYQHPLAHSATNVDGANADLGYNLMAQVRMKYIVQFKQLKQNVRYPTAFPSPVPAEGPEKFPTAANPFV